VEGDAAVHRATVDAGRTGILLAAADAVGEGVVGGDVVHRGGQLVVPVAPGHAAVAGDDRALVGDHEQDVGVVRVDPDVLVVVAARRAAYRRPGDAAVFGAPKHGRAA